MAVQAATVGDIVRYHDAPTRRRLRSAVTLAVVFWVLLVGSKAVLPWSGGLDDNPPHAPHALVTTTADDFAAVMDHQHIQDSVAWSPEILSAAVVPRIATPLVALGMFIAVAAAWLYGGHGIWAAVRGPPRGVGHVAPGRQLLTRFCISRR